MVKPLTHQTKEEIAKLSLLQVLRQAANDPRLKEANED